MPPIFSGSGMPTWCHAFVSLTYIARGGPMAWRHHSKIGTLLGIWLSITLLYFPTSTFIKTFSLFSRHSYLQSYVLFRIVMRSLPPSGSFAEFQHTFLFRKRFVGNTRSSPPNESFAEFQHTFLFRKALCWKHVWNTRSATMISSPRPRPSGD
jgi:hypothetical protein